MPTTNHTLLNSHCNSGSSSFFSRSKQGGDRIQLNCFSKRVSSIHLHSLQLLLVITTRVVLLTQNLNIPNFKTESFCLIYTVWIPFLFGLGKHSFSSLTVVLLHFIRQKKERRAPEFSRTGPAWKSVCTCKPAYKSSVK